MIKCPYCGADHTHLTADIQIMVGADVDSEGNLDLHRTDLSDIKERIYGSTSDDITLFCNNCGADRIFVTFDDNGLIIPYKED